MGHLFVNDRLLSESGMEKHPLNHEIALQPASQYDFLLIAAGQILQRHQRRSRTNAELTDRGDRGGPLLLQTP